MTKFTVTPSRNRGIDLFDPVSKSTISVPAAYCDDLKGCGGDTHNRGQYSFTANYRQNCETPQVGLQASYSGFVTRTITPSSLEEITIIDSGVSLTANITGLAIAIGQLTNGTFPDGVLKDLLGIGEEASLVEKVVGSQITLTKASNRRLVATLSRPVWELRKDNCGNDIGYFRSSSLSLYGFDDATCQVTTIWQASLGAFLASEVYGAPGEGLGTDLSNDLNAFGLMNILNAVTSAVACSGVQTAAEAIWADLENEDIEFGGSE